MPKKKVPLVSHFCRRKQIENENEIVYPQAIFKSSNVLEPFDLSGYPRVAMSCSVSRRVKERREHGYHCIYIPPMAFEELSIFDGDWVCVVVGNREKNNIISCHLASAHLLSSDSDQSNQYTDHDNNIRNGAT